MFLCVSPNGSQCDSWVEFSFIPLLDTQSAIELGFLFLSLSATAWGISMIAKTILGKK